MYYRVYYKLPRVAAADAARVLVAVFEPHPSTSFTFPPR